MLTYHDMRDLIESLLQDSTNTTYSTPELDLLIDNAVKEFAKYAPNVIDIIFKIESRTGTTTSATSLTDATKDQFVAGDATNEKVVHNTTDNTWAVVLANSDVDVNTISVDIMASGDNYRIYNKRCTNQMQIYIGDVTDYLEIDSVEYPLGEKRNWKVYSEVLEIDVDSVQDSDSTLDTPNNIDVLVRFTKPHRICQLTDRVGETTSALSAGDTFMDFDGISGTVEAGDEFNLENHRSLYTVTTGGTDSMSFFPALEADASNNDDITFRTSSLKPHHEEIFSELVVARALMSEANAALIQAKTNLTTGLALINLINKGGAGSIVPDGYRAYARAEEELARERRTMGERKLAEVIGKMEALSPPRTKRRYATA